MRTIHKYPLARQESQLVTLPGSSTMLTVQLQQGNVILWALVDTEKSQVGRVIIRVLTGGDVPPNANKYLGTTQTPAADLPGGVFVEHWFEAH